MARKKFKKGETCASKPQMKQVGKVKRCVCVAGSGAWKFLPSEACKGR